MGDVYEFYAKNCLFSDSLNLWILCMDRGELVSEIKNLQWLLKDGCIHINTFESIYAHVHCNL